MGNHEASSFPGQTGLDVCIEEGKDYVALPDLKGVGSITADTPSSWDSLRSQYGAHLPVLWFKIECPNSLQIYPISGEPGRFRSYWEGS